MDALVARLLFDVTLFHRELKWAVLLSHGRINRHTKRRKAGALYSAYNNFYLILYLHSLCLKSFQSSAVF